MRVYRSAMAAILLTSLMATAPALAQNPPASVTFDGIGLSFDGALGSSVDITTVPGQSAEVGRPSGPEPPHLAFTFYGAQSETMRVPKSSLAPGVVRFYRTEDLAAYDQASAELEALRALLSERPDLADYTVATPDGSGATLPYLPVMPASQVIRARPQYVDTPALSGVAYVTAFRQDASPFAAGDFWYTFQGLSADGRWYVVADFGLDAPMFPDQVTAKEANRVSDREAYASYLAQTIDALSQAAPDGFSPALGPIDTLVRSVTFEDAAPVE